MALCTVSTQATYVEELWAEYGTKYKMNVVRKNLGILLAIPDINKIF